FTFLSIVCEVVTNTSSHDLHFMEFKTLIAYQKAKRVYELVSDDILPKLSDRIIKDKLKRASLGIFLNIAEGTSRTSKQARKHFFVIARGSSYESFAIIALVKIGSDDKKAAQDLLEEVSKILLSLIRGLSVIDISGKSSQ